MGDPAAVTPARLLADFGPRADLALRAVRALTAAALAAPEALAAWSERLERLHGERPLDRVDPADLAALRRRHGIDDPAATAALLFAVHTWYALIIKSVAAALVPRRGGDLRARLAALEVDLAEPDAWYLGVWTGDLEAVLEDLFARPCPIDDAPAHGDLFKDLYHALVPGPVRHALGEFYTPDWLAEHTLDLAGYTGDPRTRCLDASCGSGTFLVLAIRRVRAWLVAHPDGAADALDAVVGFDINPLAVLAARVNVLVALGPQLRERARGRQIPVYRLDAVLDEDPRFHHAFNYVVGNPPHVSWRHLPAAWRRGATPLFERHGLFTLTGLAAQHGGSQKDIAALFICTVVDRLLRPGGVLALVAHVSLFKTEGAGEGFRRFIAGDVPYRVEEANDFSAFQPFATHADRAIKTRTLTFRARKGEATAYPVPYHVWTKRRRGPIPAASTWPEVQVMLDHEALAAQPLRGTTGPAARSPWMCTRPGALARIQRILAPPGHVPAYHAHVGAYTGGLNGCYWLEVLERHADGTLLVENCADVGKKAVRRVRATIEADLVHPLLRGRQAARWTSAPAGEILVVQDPRTMAGHAVAWLRARYPRTHAFLAAFEPELRARPLYRKFFAAADAPFYSMYGVRPETFAPHKVVWMEIAAMIKASVLGGGQGGRIVVPDHKVILVAVDSEPEADYLAGVLNSAVVGAALRSYAVDNNVATNLLKNVVVPKFTPDDATHAAIARAARDARLAPDAEHLARAEADLAAAVEPLWG